MKNKNFNLGKYLFKIFLMLAFVMPTQMFAYYIAGWGGDWNHREMGNNQYTYYAQTAGDYQFKISEQANWNKQWACGTTVNVSGVVTKNSCNNGDNISVKLTKNADVTISFNGSVITVTATEVTVALDAYLKGSFDTWGTGKQMTKNGDQFELKNVELGADTQLKINYAGNIWAGYDQVKSGDKGGFCTRGNGGDDNNIIISVTGTYSFYYKQASNEIYMVLESSGETGGDDEEDDYIEALECDAANTRIIYTEDFGTFSDDKGRASYSKSGTGFTAKVPTSSYTAMTTSCTAIENAGYYAVLANPFYAGCGTQKQGDTHACECNNGQWYQNITDHTGNTNGGMLFYNCRDGKSQTDILYESTVDVCQNTYINFSAYIASATAADRGCSVKAKVRFILYDAESNAELSRYTTDYIPLEEGKWEKIAVMFNSKSADKVTLKLLNLAESGCGNDLLLDDITFSVCTPKANLVCSNGTEECTLLPGQKETLTASIISGVMENPYYLWQYQSNKAGWMPIGQPEVNKTELEVIPETNPTLYRVIIANTAEEAINIAGQGNPSACGMYAITNTVTANVTNLGLISNLSDGSICADGVDKNTLTLKVTNPLNVAVTGVKVAVEIPEGVTAYNAGTTTVFTGFAEFDLAANGSKTLTLDLKSTAAITASQIKSIKSYIAKTFDLTWDSESALVKVSSDITVNPVPTAKFAVASENICKGSTTTGTNVIISNGSPNYTLTIGGTNYTATTSPYLFAVNPTSTTTYTLTKVMDAKGCYSTPTSNNTVTVNVEEIKITTHPASTSVCVGAGATFSVVASGVNKYQWQVSSDNSNWNNISGATASTYTISATTSNDNNKYYRVVVSKDGGKCEQQESNSAMLTVKTTVAPSVGTYNECAKDGQIQLSTLATGTSLKFYSDAALTSSVVWFDASDVVKDKKYYVTQTVNGCTSAAAEISVTVKGVPTLNSVSTDKNAICKGESNAELTYSVSGGIAPYTLYIERTEAGTTTIVNPSVSATGTYTLNPSSDATYKFTKVVDANGCESTSTKSVYIDVQEINVIANISDDNVCADKTKTFTVNATGDNLNYKWYESTNGGTSFTQVGTNSKTYTTGSFSMGDQKQYKVEVYQNPKVCGAVEGLAKITVQDCSGFEITYNAETSAEVCKGDNIKLKVTLKNNSSENATNVEVVLTDIANQRQVSRNPSSGSFYTHSTGIWAIPSLASGATATLTLEIEGTNVVKDLVSKAYVIKSGTTTYTEATTKAFASKKITVKDFTAAPTLIAETYKGCPVEAMLNLDTQVSSDATNLQFYTTETGSVTATQANKNTIGTTSYWVSNTEDGKCESKRTKLDIVVYPQPTASLSGNTTICKSESANLSIQLTGKANYIITLSNGDVKEGVSGNTAQMTVSPDVTTTYTIRSVIDGNGCEATTSGSAKVTVNEKPVIEFTENPLPEYCAGVEYTLPAPTVDNKGANITESGWYLAGDKLTNNKIKFTTEDNAKSLVYKAKNTCGETTATFVASLNVADCADLTLTYSLDKSSYCEGEDAVLTATLYNGSALDLNNVVVRQSWAGKQSSVLSEVSKGTYTNNIWSIGKLTQGETVTLTISFKVEEAEVFEIYVSAANGETYTFDNSVEKSTAQLVVKSYSDNVTVNNYAKCPINANSFLITDLVTSDKNDLKVWTKNAATGLYEKLDEVPTIDPKQTLPATTYYITNTERGKCESTTPTAVTVEVFPQPTASLSGSTTICKGGSANLLVTLSGEPSYTVKLSDGSEQTLNATENIPVSPTSTTTYTLLEVKDGHGCYATPSGSAKVTVNNKPVITLSRVDLDAFCPGDVLTLPANVEVEDNGATITSQGWLLNGASTTSPIELNASHNNAVIEYTATNECGTATAVEYATIVVKEVSGNVVARDYIACPVDNTEFPITDLVTSNNDGLKVMGKNDAGEYYDITSVPMVNPSVQTASTTYYITNTENGKCESTTPTPVTVEVYKPVSASISAPKEVCYGSYSAVEISLDGEAPYNVVYNNGTANVPLNRVTASSVSINDALYTTTTYSLVSVTDDNGCEATITTDDQATITVNELPTIASVEIEDDDDYICQGTTTNLIVTFTGNAPFRFTINGTQYKSDDNEFEMEISQAGRYVVENLVDAKCSSAADSQASATLFVEAIPVLNVTPASVLLNCNLPKTTISASGAFTYSWTDDKQSAPKSGSELEVKQTGSQTIYTVVGTSEHGCVSAPVSVTVQEDFVKPYAEIVIRQLDDSGAQEEVKELNCTHSRIVLDADITQSQETIVKYEWSTLSENNSTGVTAPGVYTLTVTGENGCTYTTDFEVTQNVTKPELTIENYVIDPETGNQVSTSVLTCADTEITLSVESQNANATEGVEFKWYDTQDFEIAEPLATGNRLDINAPAEYIVVAKGGNGCRVFKTFDITEDKENPNVEISASSDIITCSEPVVELTATSDVIVSYEWNDTNKTTSATLNVEESGVYEVLVTAGNGCTNTDSYTVTQRTDLPVVEITPSEEKVTCKPNTLTASGAKTYTWSTEEAKDAIEVTIGGTYTVYGTNEYGCVGEAEITLEEDKLAPSIKLTADTTWVTCRREKAVLTAEITNAEDTRTYSYAWAQNNVVSNVTKSTFDAKVEATYKVTITDETNACKAEKTINIKENKQNPLIDIKSLPSVCLPATVDLKDAVGPNTKADEVKYFADETLTQQLTDTNIEAAENAVYYVVGYEIDNNGCVGDPIAIPVVLKPSTSKPVVENYDECAEVGTKTLSSLVKSDKTKLVFFEDETSEAPIADLFSTSAENTTTTYWVSNTKTGACESERVAIEVKIAGYIDFSVDASQTRLPAGQEVTITVTPLSDTPVDEYVWYRGDEVVQATDELELTEQLYLNEKYSVQAVGRCNSPKKEVDVEAIWPTAFTPHNGNGKNDSFADGMNIIVFNRFYTKIYEGPDGWDGSINGAMNDGKETAVPGVYYYSVQLPNGQVKKGTIEIVKVD